MTGSARCENMAQDVQIGQPKNERGKAMKVSKLAPSHLLINPQASVSVLILVVGGGWQWSGGGVGIGMVEDVTYTLSSPTLFI